MTLKILDTTVISKNFRISIPSGTRKLLGAVPGDKIVYFMDEKNKEIIIRKS